MEITWLREAVEFQGGMRAGGGGLCAASFQLVIQLPAFDGPEPKSRSGHDGRVSFRYFGPISLDPVRHEFDKLESPSDSSAPSPPTADLNTNRHPKTRSEAPDIAPKRSGGWRTRRWQCSVASRDSARTAGL